MAYIVLFVAFHLSVLGFMMCFLHAPVLTMLVTTPFLIRALLRDC